MLGPTVRRLAVVAVLLALVAPAAADPKVQELTGRIAPEEDILYALDGLKKGQKLFIFAERTGGGFDPMVLLPKPDVKFEDLRTEARAELKKIIQAGKDPLLEMPDLLARFTLAWDDDSGPEDAAALEFKVPADGDYRLLVRDAFASSTFGSFRLLVGLDAPKVLTGKATPTGAEIARYERVAEPREKAGKSVCRVEGKLTPGSPPLLFPLETLRAGKTLYLYAEALSGDLKPILFLTDHAGKPMLSANYAAAKPVAKLTYKIETEQRDLQVRITSTPTEGEATTGAFRLLVGVDAPEVLTGRADDQGAPALRQAIPVKIGLSLYQIADIDQKAERYDGVYELMMRWRDPALAYRPTSPADAVRVFVGDEFDKYAKENRILTPLFTLHNQQGNRWAQTRGTAVFPDGRAAYYERFSTTLQAPDFEFRRFPFDTQKFFARIDMILPTQNFTLEELEGFSHVGEALGEEEWVVRSFETITRDDVPPGRQPHATFSFIFYANRHLNYYILRIFLPILAIIIIAWVTFFLKDYAKRVDLAGANLLVFIAFNFTIAGDLPRLGYLTFMDIALISTFVITAVVLIVCIWLRHLQDTGREQLARKLDTYLICLYPILYLVTVGGGAWMTFT